MTTLEYRGYIGSVTFDAEAEILHGTVVNTRDVITFQGESVSEIKQAFKESVEIIWLSVPSWARNQKNL